MIYLCRNCVHGGGLTAVEEPGGGTETEHSFTKHTINSKGMKKFYILMILALAVSGVRAQQSEEVTRQQDSLQRVVNQLTAERDSYKQADLNRRIWKDRAKYFNIGYVKQTLTDKVNGGDIKSDFGISLSSGKTYYLHKKPIAGMIKFGLDWTWMDINYAKSTWNTIDSSTKEASSSAMHQAEIGMQFGASVTVNPIHHLKVSGYFRVTPSYSGLYRDETFYNNYVTMWNAGCAIAWKLISVGAEWRWGQAKYKGLSIDDEMMNDDDASFDDVVKTTDRDKFKTSTLRLYVSFRF